MVIGYDVLNKFLDGLRKGSDVEEKGKASLGRALFFGLYRPNKQCSRAERYLFRNIEYAIQLQFDLGNDVLSYMNKTYGQVLESLMTGEEITADEQVLLEKTFGQIVEMFDKSVLSEVQKIFTSPQLHLQDKHPSSSSSSPINQPNHESLLCFIDFLLETLNRVANTYAQDGKKSDDDEDEEEEDQMGMLEELDDAQRCEESDERIRYARLGKELTILFTILGDVFFQEQSNILLMVDFQTVCIEIGNLIFSSLFKKLTPTLLHEKVNHVMEKIASLNIKIKEHCVECIHCIKSSDLRVSPRLTNPFDSLFIIDSLLKDLDNFTDSKSDFTIDNGIIAEVNILQEELKGSQPLLKPIYMIPGDMDVDDESKKSIVEMRDASYEAEYLIHSHVMRNLPTWYLKLRIPSVISKIKLTNTRLHETCKNYGAGIKTINNLSTDTSSQPLIIPGGVVNDHVVEFGEIRKKIMRDLIRESKGQQVISIFGMPGVGKTTIAKKLYDDRAIQNRFDERAWCVVSQAYDKRRVLIDILRSLSSNKLSQDDIQKLEDEDIGLKIHQSLYRQRYIIVIDDIWQSSTLNDLREYFPKAGSSSTIMLTSRIKNVAPTNSIYHPLPLLSEDQSWELLKGKLSLDEDCPPQLLATGKAISTRCGGLPLALVVTAGILAKLKRDESAWEKVKDRLEMHMLDDVNSYRKILELSFEHLPNHLKLCFLYLGVFPQGTEIRVNKIIRMWIAERFIQKTENKSLENVAKDYVDELISRSLLVIASRASDGEVKRCTIHDLLREMCIRRSQEENFMECLKRDNFSVLQKHKCLCVHSESLTWRNLGQNCRTFVGHLSESQSCFVRPTLLRVIDVLQARQSTDIHLQKRLKFFGLPAQLRYLSFGTMPDSEQGKLSNLEFLGVERKSGNNTIPSVILKTENLRHLRVKPSGKFNEDCDISQTNNLRYLSHVLISNEKDKEILRCSSHLLRLKCTCDINAFPDFKFFTELESLTVKLDATSMVQCFEESSPAGETKYIIQLNPNARDKLGFKMSFPVNIKKLHLNNMVILSEDLSIVGRLPSLHVLKLSFIGFEGDEWNTEDDEFPELKFLKIHFTILKQWNTCSEPFPKLKHLVLRNCESLQEIPTDFGYHCTLEKIEMSGYNEVLKESAALVEERQHGNGNEEFKVICSGQTSR